MKFTYSFGATKSIRIKSLALNPNIFYFGTIPNFISVFSQQSTLFARVITFEFKFKTFKTESVIMLTFLNELMEILLIIVNKFIKAHLRNYN